VLNQEFLVSEMQKVLYAVESFEQIYEAAQQAEERLGLAVQATAPSAQKLR
jgi:phenylalanine-4-hydroxylase